MVSTAREFAQYAVTAGNGRIIRTREAPLDTSYLDWQRQESNAWERAKARLEALTPEPLFHSNFLQGSHVCLVCGEKRAVAGLFSTHTNKLIVPICQGCTEEWSLYGYRILLRLPRWQLLARLAKWAITHPRMLPQVIADLRDYAAWGQKMARLRKMLKSSG